jgi:NADH-quinone oxidoreductase subunit N
LTEFESISNYIWLSETSEIGLSLGAAFIIMALLFKLAAAPFHMWAPDVYEGASTIVTAFFAIVPKIAVLSLLITLIYGPFLGIFENLIQPIIIISGLMSILVGSIAAINQTKIKRLLAYSAIAHMGWILIGLGVGTLMSIQATLIYIVLYILMSINSFAFVISYFKGYGNNYITQLSGLSRKEPILAITFSLCLLSIAGIPPLAGFYSKYNILLALIDEKFIITSILGIVLSVIGSFYYIRIIQWMYFNNSSDYIIKDLGDIVYKQTDTGVNSTIGLNQSLILGSSLFFILTYLIYPNPLVILTFDGISNLIY